MISLLSMDLLWIVLLGGVLALDGVAAVQSMISRPLVAGWLAGWILGDVVTGIQIGVLLELQLLVAVPSGGGHVPEGGTATLVAVATAVGLTDSGVLSAPGALAWGIAVALVWGQIVGQSQIWMRRINQAPLLEVDPSAFDRRAVSRAQRRGILLDALRGMLLTGIGILLARGIVPPLAGGWPLDPGATFSALLLGAWVSVGILLRGVAPGRGRAVLFGAGLLLGALWLGGTG